jgi:hypothetical protein
MALIRKKLLICLGQVILIIMMIGFMEVKELGLGQVKGGILMEKMDNNQVPVITV